MLGRTLGPCLGSALLLIAGCGGPMEGTADAGRDAARGDVGVGSEPGHAPDSGARDFDANLRDLDAGIDSSARVDSGRVDSGTDARTLDMGTTFDDGGIALGGDCVTNADCTGGTCVDLTPGYRVCRFPPVPATACVPGRPDACCTSADCAMGGCFLGPIHPSCGGAIMLPVNECAADECGAGRGCTGGVCAPAGTFAPVATCVQASCLANEDCRAEAGGRCVVALDPCCGVPVGLVCSYPSDGCRSNADCGRGHCEVADGRARCVTTELTCPL